MNTQIKCYLLFLLLLIAGFSYAQDADNTRMKRDIEVAENILSTLLNQESNYYGNSVEGTYIEGHGALFTINSGSFISVNGYNKAIVLSTDASQNGVYQLGETTGKSVNIDSLNTALQARIKDVMKTFITDYAQLLSQLKPTEKILIRYTRGNRYGDVKVFGLTSRLAAVDAQTTVNKDKNKTAPDKTLKELSAEIMKASVDDYRSGKLTKAQLEQKIKYSEQNVTDKKETDLELLSSIFHRLYQDDLSETFRLYSDPSYEKIEGLGVIFTMNFGGRFFGRAAYSYSFSTRAGDRVWSSSPSQNKKKSDKEEEDDSDWQKKIEESYPDFLETFKQNMIEYGRTVHTLNADELLIFKLDLMNCDDCDIPAAVELSVKNSVLEDYDKNKISIDQAVEKITVKETRD